MSLVDVTARTTRSCSSNLRRASDDSQPPHRGTLFWNRNTEFLVFLFFINTEDYGSAKESVEPEAVNAIAINNGVLAHLQQHSDRRVSDAASPICGASSLTRACPSLIDRWTLILVETVKRVLTYRSLHDLSECAGLWKAVEVPLKICQTAAFLEVRTRGMQPFSVR